MFEFLSELREISANSAVKSFLLAVALLCPHSPAQTQAGIPPEVRYKSGYINPVGKPPEFSSAMLWGIAIADTRVPGYEKAQVEIARTQLTCKVAGRDFVLNDDRGAVHGGLYRRYPWFGTDAHDPIALAYSDDHTTVILRVGTVTNRVWHFWAASPRAALPAGHFEGCTVSMRVRISQGALLQVGFDYWRDTKIDYGLAGCGNRDAAT